MVGWLRVGATKEFINIYKPRLTTLFFPSLYKVSTKPHSPPPPPPPTSFFIALLPACVADRHSVLTMTCTVEFSYSTKYELQQTFPRQQQQQERCHNRTTIIPLTRDEEEEGDEEEVKHGLLWWCWWWVGPSSLEH